LKFKSKGLYSSLADAPSSSLQTSICPTMSTEHLRTQVLIICISIKCEMVMLGTPYRHLCKQAADLGVRRDPRRVLSHFKLQALKSAVQKGLRSIFLVVLCQALLVITNGSGLPHNPRPLVIRSLLRAQYYGLKRSSLCQRMVEAEWIGQVGMVLRDAEFEGPPRTPTQETRRVGKIILMLL
jgi:hypothetical protein